PGSSSADAGGAARAAGVPPDRPMRESNEVPEGTPGDEGIDEAISEAFETELAEARREADENWDRYLRAEADLENMRRRSGRLRDEAVQREKRELLLRFLEIADNLELALEHADSDPAALAEGVTGTYRAMGKALAGQGVEQIPALDQPFDPELHEAVGVVPAPGATEEKVVAVDRNGYTLDGDLLRPARVIVGQPAHRPVGDG
ncbi:MAG: nucleotide exchange factor GrpE, partial [Anaerolineae bacterium]